jgi:hypothetical protein
MLDPAGRSVEWLCALGRRDLDDGQAARLGELTAAQCRGQTPEATVSLLATAGLLPLAYRHLVAVPRVAMQSEVSDAIATEFRRHAASRLLMARRLRDLLSALASAGIDALPYKGPVLAVQLYGNFALRQYGDLDIIVHPRATAAALACLARCGVAARGRALALADSRDRRRHEYALVDQETGTLVELHWALADWVRRDDADVEWLMAGREPVWFMGQEVSANSTERLIVSLMLHGSRHVWARLSWMAELATVLRRTGIDWDTVAREIRRLRSTRPFEASLILARDLFDAPVFDGFRPDRRSARLARSVTQRLARGATTPVGLEARLEWEWRAAASIGARMRLVWRLALTPSVRDAEVGASGFRRSWAGVLPRALRLVRTAAAERRSSANRA